jgi:hypothetical protein
MIRVGKFTKLISCQLRNNFASDKFMKERDEAAEKVFISRQ